MKKIGKAIAVILIFILLLSVSACTKREDIIDDYNEKYINDYVIAILENGYKNDSTAFVKLELGTAEEAEKLYKEGLASEVEGVAGSNATAAEKSEWSVIMAQVLAAVKYSVKSVTANEDDTFLVVLEYEQQNLFEKILPRYYELISENQKQFAAESTTEEEFYSKIAGLYRQSFRETLETLTYKPAATYSFTIAKNADGQYEVMDEVLDNLELLFVDIEFAMNYEPPAETEDAINPGVELGQYLGIEVERTTIEVSDDEVLLSLYEGLYDYAVTPNRKNVKKYDIVNIDYEGTIDGVAFEGGNGTNVELMVGAGSFMESFEKGIIGANIGTKASITLKYPDNYPDETLAGKTAVFGVTVNSIKAVPEMTDKFVSGLGIEGVGNYNELVAYVRLQLEMDAEDEVEAQFRYDVLKKIAEGCTFDDTLEAEIAANIEAFREQYTYYASMYQMTLEEYLNTAYEITLQEFEKQIAEISDEDVRYNRILLAVALQENIICTDDEVDSYIEEIMNKYSYESVEAVLADFPYEEVRYELMRERALIVILGNTIVK